MRIYAIGDVHGCRDALREVHGWIRDDLSRRPTPDWRIIHLGDFIDRGPDSPGVLDDVLEWSADTHVLSVCGNHDSYLTTFLADPLDKAYELWANYGGRQTIAAYGVDSAMNPEADQAQRQALHTALSAQVPPAHVAFISGLPMSLRFGDYLFVHAGIRPGVPLAEQTARDFMWTREPFLSYPDTFDFIVVHGHTPVHEIEVRHNRIGIDTGCVFGRQLSCLVLDGAEKAQLVGSWLEPLPEPV